MRYHKSVTEMLLMQLLRFSDDVVLPFDLTRYAVKIKTDWEQWKLEFGEILVNQSISIGLFCLLSINDKFLFFSMEQKYILIENLFRLHETDNH